MDIVFGYLMEEMLNYAKGQQAHDLYLKCLRLGKLKLAEKIYNKYRGIFPKEHKSDLAMAMGLSLMAQDKIKNN